MKKPSLSLYLGDGRAISFFVETDGIISVLLEADGHSATIFDRNGSRLRHICQHVTHYFQGYLKACLVFRNKFAPVPVVCDGLFAAEKSCIPVEKVFWDRTHVKTLSNGAVEVVCPITNSSYCVSPSRRFASCTLLTPLVCSGDYCGKKRPKDKRVPHAFVERVFPALNVPSSLAGVHRLAMSGTPGGSFPEVPQEYLVKTFPDSDDSCSSTLPFPTVPKHFLSCDSSDLTVDILRASALANEVLNADSGDISSLLPSDAEVVGCETRDGLFAVLSGLGGAVEAKLHLDGSSLLLTGGADGHRFVHWFAPYADCPDGEEEAVEDDDDGDGESENDVSAFQRQAHFLFALRASPAEMALPHCDTPLPLLRTGNTAAALSRRFQRVKGISCPVPVEQTEKPAVVEAPEVVEKVTLPDVGVLVAYSDGSIKGVFFDRTLVYFDREGEGLTVVTAAGEEVKGRIGGVLPPALLRYVKLVQQFATWARKTPVQRAQDATEKRKLKSLVDSELKKAKIMLQFGFPPL